MSFFSRECTGKRIVILCYEAQLLPNWDPDCFAGAGSEEAIMYASRALVRSGNIVTVFFQPPEKSLWSLPMANPRYLSVADFSTSTERFDFVV